jgi:hypothetical protein
LYLEDMRDELRCMADELRDSPLLTAGSSNELGDIYDGIDNLDRLKLSLDTPAGRQQYIDSLERVAASMLNIMLPLRDSLGE